MTYEIDLFYNYTYTYVCTQETEVVNNLQVKSVVQYVASDSRQTNFRWNYQPFRQNPDLASNTNHLEFLNSKVHSEWQMFREFFKGNFIYASSFCQKSAERKSLKK